MCPPSQALGSLLFILPAAWTEREYLGGPAKACGIRGARARVSLLGSPSQIAGALGSGSSPAACLWGALSVLHPPQSASEKASPSLAAGPETWLNCSSRPGFLFWALLSPSCPDPNGKEATALSGGSWAEGFLGGAGLWLQTPAPAFNSNGGGWEGPKRVLSWGGLYPPLCCSSFREQPPHLTPQVLSSFKPPKLSLLLAWASSPPAPPLPPLLTARPLPPRVTTRLPGRKELWGAQEEGLG